MKEKTKLTKVNKLHILLIIAGMTFAGASIFHTNIWFDESYSVGMATHNWIDIWNIGGHDVHPVLYYWVLSIINVVTGGSFIAYRIFSWLCIAILGLLGYTHIRKDFGDKTGILFSFFSYFLPTVCIFAQDIRMYTMALLLVTLCAIYGFRIFKGDTSWKNWIIFELTSLASIYTHYYGLMAAGLINVIMLINFIRNRRSESTKRILIFGILQFLLYIPWILYLRDQMQHVASAFWIEFNFPYSHMELSSFQFIGAMENYYVGFTVAVLLYIYMIIKTIKLIKNKEETLPIKLSVGLYVGIIIAALIVTKILHSEILYYRYLFVVTGFYIFAISFVLSKEKNKIIIGIICAVTLVLGTITNVKTIKDNYDSSNMKQIEYLKENIQEGDVIVYEDIGAGSVIADYFPNNKQYYYNAPNWGVQEAYKAFGPQMDTYVTDDFFGELSGRVWIVDGWSDNLYKDRFENEDYNLISREEFSTAYQGYHYIFFLVERNN